MISKFVELTNGFNWGKFLVCQFTYEEWCVRSQVDQGPLVAGRGWTGHHAWVLDLQTGEGAMFDLKGHAIYDLAKHKVWVCPMFSVFLTWLQTHKEHHTDITTIPTLIELTEEETKNASALYGFRRRGVGGWCRPSNGSGPGARCKCGKLRPKYTPCGNAPDDDDWRKYRLTKADKLRLDADRVLAEHGGSCDCPTCEAALQYSSEPS